jgi:hypothetical protein
MVLTASLSIIRLSWPKNRDLFKARNGLSGEVDSYGS